MSRLEIPYTEAERTQTNYTVGQAVKVAALLLKGKPMCVNALSDRYYTRDLSTPITLVELNSLSDQLVDDSHYYG